MLGGVVERGEKLEPPLDSRIVVSRFADAFERLAIRKFSNLRAPKVASKAFDGPDNAASFHVERSPVPLGIEGSPADVCDGPHCAVRLLLFESSTKTVDARVAIHVEGAGAVGYGVTVGETEPSGVASSARSSRTITSMAGVNSNLTPFLRREVIGRIRLDKTHRNLR